MNSNNLYVSNNLALPFTWDAILSAALKTQMQL